MKVYYPNRDNAEDGQSSIYRAYIGWDGLVSDLAMRSHSRRIAHRLVGGEVAWIGIMKDGVDQVQRFMNAQRVSSSEAAWSIMRFKINTCSHAVTTVQIHCPGDNWVVLDEIMDTPIEDELTYREAVADATISKLERYLQRPATRIFDNLTLVEYYEKFRVCKWKDVPAYAKQVCLGDRYPAEQRMQVYRLRGAEHLVYVPRRSPTQGQVFYIRLLLCNIPARSWEELRDRIHSTGDRVNALVRNVVYPALLQ
eukprot:COSAG01_NODE_5130_length_4466_cov_23.058621_4_plen_253_part_00